MSSSKVEMSLDDIIKENKNKGAKKGSRKDSKASNGILRSGKKILKPSQKNRLQKGKASSTPRNGPKRVVRTSKQTPSTVATKRLVQKLVKKALAQSNVQTQVVSRRKAFQSPKIRGRRVARKAVMVNRLKLNPRSRLINRRSRGNAVVENVVEVRGRGQTRFLRNAGNAAVVRRLNYVPVASRPVMLRTVPQVVVRQQRERRIPVYQPRNIMQGRPSLRDHISQLRTSISGGTRQAAPQVVYVNRPPRQQRSSRQLNFRQQQVTNFQPPQRRQSQRNNFLNRRSQQFKSDPFFEPPNFLQRLPVWSVPQNTIRGVRRY